MSVHSYERLLGFDDVQGESLNEEVLGWGEKLSLVDLLLGAVSS